MEVTKNSIPQFSENNKKFRFIGRAKSTAFYRVHQIVAISSFGSVKEGDIGGWIEKEENLSIWDDSWVADEACIFGDAKVGRGAIVRGGAIVSGDSRVLDSAIVEQGAKIHNSYIEGGYVGGSAIVKNGASIGEDGIIKGTEDYMVIHPIVIGGEPMSFYRTGDGISLYYEGTEMDIDLYEEMINEKGSININMERTMETIQYVRSMMGANK